MVNVSADNLGSHSLGGFKEGGRALRCCRHCLVPSSELEKTVCCIEQTDCICICIIYVVITFQFTETEVEMRTSSLHSHHCQLLEGSLREFYSTNYGVTRNSVLNDLQYFHVADEGLPPDIMHDVLEGYLPYKVKLMLSHFVVTTKYLTLEQVNQGIANFDYGPIDSADKPSQLPPSVLTSSDNTHLCQSGRCYWIVPRPCSK